MKKASWEEMAIAIKALQPGKAVGASEVCAQMISANRDVGIGVIMELGQRVLDGKGMPDKWQKNVKVPIFKEKGDERSCNEWSEVIGA